MAISSKINIDIDSAAFAAFQAKFDKYKAALDKTPAAWRGVGAEVAKTKTSFEAVANSIATQAGTMALISKHSSDFYNVTTATARHWHNLSISTASVAKNIVGATESLLKWTGIISLVTGGAGLFGFDRLAQSVSGQRTAALGTGGDYGARAAFVTNFRRFGDPEGLLGRIAEAQTNIKESVPLTLLGLTRQDLKGDPTEVAIKALRNAAQIAKRDKATGFPIGSDPHLQLFTGPERIRLRDMPEKELEEMVAKMRADQKNKRFHLDPSEQKAYQDFLTKMNRAGQQIETIFVKGLVKLENPLERLSKSAVNLVDKFMTKDGPIDRLLTDLSHGLDWLAGEVDKPEFQKTVDGFIQNIGSLAISLGSMLAGLANFSRWLGIATPAAASTPEAVGKTSAPFGMGPLQRGKTSAPFGMGPQQEGRSWHGEGKTNAPAGMGPLQSGQSWPRTGGGAGNIPDRNLNPGDIHDSPWTRRQPGYLGSFDKDQGDPLVRFDTAEHGWAAMEALARNKYHRGMRTADQLIAGPHGWTPGRLGPDAAKHVAAALGIGPGDDLQLDDRAHMRAFKRALAIQEGSPPSLINTLPPLSKKSNVSVQPVPGGNTSLGSAAAAAGSP